jgi:hypothetical protein
MEGTQLIGFDWEFIWAIGSVLIFCGTLIAMVRTHGKNITALWNQKQDKNVCIPEHTHVNDTLDRIESNVDWLVKRAKNGGQV